jgi:hypothetical protein
VTLLATVENCMFAAEIFFSGLHGDVAQQKLNLFQLAPGAVAEART